MLLHKEAHYALGTTPLALLWKDHGCSRFPIDTDASGVVPPHQMLILQYQDNGTVATSDNPPHALGRMPDVFVHRMGASLRHVCIAARL